MKNLTWQNPEQLFVAQELINKVKSKCCGIKVVLKYKYNIDPHFSLQPFFGGYFALGVGGKIKNFEQREAQNSFNDDNFRRVDGGLRLGCGVQYDMFYADLTYDIGLANICHDTFDTSHNGGLQLNFGVNF